MAVDTIRGDLTEVTGVCNEPDHVGYSVVNTGTTVRFIDLNNRLGGQYCFGFIVNRDPNPLDGPPLAIFYDGVNIVGNLTVTANSIIYRIRDAEAVFAGLETLGYNHYQLCTNHTDVTLYNDCGFIDSQSFSHEGFGDLSFVGFLKDVLSADAAGFGVLCA